MNAAHQPRFVALVPAGGVGLRAASSDARLPKQYQMIGARPMIAWAVAALLADARIEHVWVGVQPEDAWAARALAGIDRLTVSQTAGQTRAETVLQTLRAAELGRNDWVLVHDAARPGLPADALSRLIDACIRHDRGGLLALPAADTVKLARGQPVSVGQTLARDSIWLAQTPQMFRAGELTDALSAALAARFEVTDEASAMERVGQQPLLVPGAPQNLKVTWPEDFRMVRAWL